MFEMRFGHIASVLVLLLIAMACSGDDEAGPAPAVSTAPPTLPPAAAPSSTPSPATATPEPTEPIIHREAGWGDVVGPVLVYELGTSNQFVVAYDLGRARRVWSLPKKLTDDLAISDVAVAADGIVIAMPEAVFYQGFNGSPLEKLFDAKPGWESIESVSVAPDGATLAVSVSVPAVPFGTPTAFGHTYRFTGRILFYDL